MKTRFRSILCALLALCTLISLPIAAEAKTSLYNKWQDEVPGTYGTHYDAEKAIQHAKENWNDGIGVCDQFVKSCLRAGGIIIAAGDVDPVKDALIAIGLGAEQKLVISDNGGRVYAEDNPGVQAGDMLNFYCHDCGESVHTVLIGGTIEDSRGNYFYTYGHNPGWNEEIDWIGNFTHTADNGEKHSDFTLNVVKISREKLACRHSFVYQENKLNLYEKHPHKMYVKCENCSVKYYLGWNASYVSTCTTCNPPLGDKPVVTATAEENKIFLEWSTVEGAVNYKVERYRQKDGKPSVLKTLMSTTLSNTIKEEDIGVTFYYTVTAILADGSTRVSEMVSCRISDGRPAAPVITGTFNKDNHAVISWKATENAATYEIFRGDSPSSTFTSIGTTSSTSYTDKKVIVGRTYYYKVTAISADGKASDYSNYVAVAYKSDKPIVTATVEDKAIALYWTIVDGAQGYQVSRAKSENGTYFKLSEVAMPKFTNSSVDPGVVYYYKVTAILEKDEAGNITKSSVSDIVSCMIPVGKPAAPKISAKTDAASGKPVISWDAVLGAKEYKVYRATSSKGTYTKVGTVSDTSFEDTSAAVGKKYYYKVKAVGVDGETSSYSSYKSAYSKCAAPVVTISNTASSGKSKLKWTKVTGAKQYYVYRATSKTGKYSKVKSTTGSSFTDSDASVGKTYYYKVIAKASKSTYDSAYSEVLKGKRICAQPDLVVKRNTSTGKPNLSWDKVSGAKEYKVYRSFTLDGVYDLIKTTTSTSYKDSKVLPGMECYYRVDVIGSKSGTNSVQEAPILCRVTCGKPSVSVKNDTVTGDPIVSWKSVDGAVFYRVLRSTKSSSGFKEVAMTMELSYQDEAATSGKKYYYKVEALDDAGDPGSASSAKSVYSKLPQPEIAITLSSKKPKVTWAAVAGVKKYEVYRATSKNGSYKKVKTTTGTSYKDKSAKKGKTYYYKVKAVASSSSANSAYSAKVNIKSK